MIKDTVRPNGTIKRVQYVKANRGGTSSMGRRYKKGDPILHLSSSRCTGETFVLLPSEICEDVLAIKAEFGHEWWASKRPGKWASPKKWSESLTEQYHRIFLRVYGHTLAEFSRCTAHTHEQHFELSKKMKEELKKRV